MGEVAHASQAVEPQMPARPLEHGLPLTQVLRVPSLAGTTVLAGAQGLNRLVQRLNVMEVPDILPWVKPCELLLATGYPLRDAPEALVDLVTELDARGLSALAVRLGRYLDELPPEMLAAGDRLGFPILRLPAEIAFDDVITQVLTEVLDTQAAALSRADEVHRSLVDIVLAGGGLAEVTDQLVNLLGGVVIATTPDGRVLARSGSEADLAVLKRSGRFDSSGRLRTEEEGVGLRAAPGGGVEPRRAPTVHTHDDLDGNHAVVPIVAGSLDHGRIAAFSPCGSLVESDVPTLERAAMVAALTITKELAVAAVEDKYRGDFLRDLLEGRAGDVRSAVAHCASLGWDVDRPVVVVVAELDATPGPAGSPAAPHGPSRPPPGPERRPAQERFAAAWTQVVRHLDPRAPVVGFSSEIVAVVGVPSDGDVGRLVSGIVGQVRGDGGGGRRPFTAGVGRVATTPERIPAAYTQARTAVAVGRRVYGGGSVAYFDALGVFRLLSQVPDGGELRGFLLETLGELATRDDADADDLRQTLRVLLESNLNVAETARELHFHYNTLRYRIAKLQRMLGPFCEDPHLRLSITLALQVLQMRGVVDG